MLRGINGYCSAVLDFKKPVSINKSFVIASSFRCGSTHLSVTLWETGVLGAPWEYFNYEGDKRFMSARLVPSSPGDYIRKLTACRTSSNGVFGVKAHFRHFEVQLRQYPPLLDVLSPVKFIYINRQDKLAQAVSLSRALQTNAWYAFNEVANPPLFYSKEFIEECVKEVDRQTNAWTTWFEQRRISPLVVNYEDLLADKDAITAEIKRFLGVENDQGDKIALPKTVRQSDGRTADWIRRFRSDSGVNIQAALADSHSGFQQAAAP